MPIVLPIFSACANCYEDEVLLRHKDCDSGFSSSRASGATSSTGSTFNRRKKKENTNLFGKYCWFTLKSFMHYGLKDDTTRGTCNMLSKYKKIKYPKKAKKIYCEFHSFWGYTKLFQNMVKMVNRMKVKSRYYFVKHVHTCYFGFS